MRARRRGALFDLILLDPLLSMQGLLPGILNRCCRDTMDKPEGSSLRRSRQHTPEVEAAAGVSVLRRSRAGLSHFLSAGASG
jgi:hypothetical protein